MAKSDIVKQNAKGFRLPGSPAPTRGTRRCPDRPSPRTPPATRWPGCGSGGRRWTRAFGLIRLAAEDLAERAGGPARLPCEPVRGRAAGCAEAPQGEVLYDVEVAGGRVVRCQPRSASFHNLVLMHEVFAGHILTDFPFIEASFGLSVAGVAL
jgi:Respiratory-chain NADH dehydrogenase, 49 Kd subunit